MHCTMHNEYNAQGPYSSSNNQVQAPDYLVNSIAASKMKICAEISILVARPVHGAPATASFPSSTAGNPRRYRQILWI